MPKPECEKIPVTLVTGFLGAGKTTLLNHILRCKGDRRVAVVENEVGEINIDNSLVDDTLISKEDLVSMDRGCVCCSLRGDILKALGELHGRGAARGAQYDHILFETTGLADPAPVAFTFFSNAWVSANFRLDAILCLVDARHLERHLQDAGGAAGGAAVNEAVNQIAFADVILLNKCDLVTPAELAAARDLVRSINVTADLVEVTLARAGGVDAATPPGVVRPLAAALRPGAAALPGWDRLMDINSFSIERALEVDPGFMDSDSDPGDRSDGGGRDHGGRDHGAPRAGGGAAPPAAGGEPRAGGGEPRAGSGGAGGDGDPAEAPPSPAAAAGAKRALDDDGGAAPRRPKRRRRALHDLSGVGSVGITARGPLDRYLFNAFMRDLLAEKARDIFRCKGVLCVKGQESTKFVFQGVHETICFGPAADAWPPGEVPLNRIVFIGRSLPRAALVEGFRSCVWVPLPDGWAQHFCPKTGQPYYAHAESGARSWERPAYASAHVTAHETCLRQPRSLQPAAAAAAPS